MKIAILNIVTPIYVIMRIILNGPSVSEIVERDLGLRLGASIIYSHLDEYGQILDRLMISRPQHGN